MKLKIKVKRKYLNNQLPEVIDKGEWVDLRSAEDVELKAPQAGKLTGNSSRDITFDSKLIRLGVAMQLPKGFEAVVLPRSSTFKNFGVILANSQGIIDYSYKGNNDEWRFNAIAFRNTTINAGDRICQFRIQLSQKATVWQKIKWFLSSGIKFVEVSSLDNNNRGGIGSTGVK